MPRARIWFPAVVSSLAFTVTVFARAAPPAAETTAAVASVWLPAIFADRMVLQREMPVPVWGRCEPGAEVSDVLVGEVWIACGQSNMGFQVATSAERDDAEMRRRDFPLLRVAMAGRHNPHEVTEPQADVGNGKPIVWRETSEHVGSCSAVGYYFARDLTRWLDGKVPVGVIELIAILPVQSWADDAVLEAVPPLANLRGKPYPNATSRAYMANIVPLAPYAVRGVIYYQGEMNGAGCGTYYHGLKAMMASWRAAWGRPEIPFMLVQLPGFLVHQAGKSELDMDAQAVAAAAGKNHFHPFIGLREAGARVADGPIAREFRREGAGYPEVTLFNQEGLPARPFRHPAIDLGPLQKECETAK